MYDFTVNLEAATSRPSVLSLSYAWSEEQQCIGLTDQIACQKLKLTNTEYVNRINNEFMKIGLLGTTILCASGDRYAVLYFNAQLVTGSYIDFSPFPFFFLLPFFSFLSSFFLVF